MSEAVLEHVNITVADPVKTADRLCRLFGWEKRWEGPSAMGGYSVHVGGTGSYVAVYNPGDLKGDRSRKYTMLGGLNHVGVVVDDIEAAEARVIAEGLVPGSHANYEPGRRFYFTDEDAVEYEVVSYG